MLMDLNKEYLRDMGITPLGDIIAILKHAKTVHENVSRAFIMSESSEESNERKPTSSTLNRLMDHFSLKLKEAKDELTSKKETPLLRPSSSSRGGESQSKAPKPSVKLGGSSIAVSDSDETDESEPKIRHPVKDKKPASVQLKPEGKVTRERSNIDSARPAASQKLCVFSRLGNAGEKTGNAPQDVVIKKEPVRVQPSEKAAKSSQPERPTSSVKTMASSELKMIKITTEFSDDDDVEVHLPETAIAAKVAIVNTKVNEGRRKRLHANDTQELDREMPLVTAAKKVRFGGTSTRVIPADSPLKSPVFLGHTVVVKTPNPAAEKFEARRTAAARLGERKEVKVNVKVERPRLDAPQTTQIKSRIGIVRPTPAKPISKMVADTIRAKPESVKSRIDLKKNKGGKISILERLG